VLNTRSLLFAQGVGERFGQEGMSGEKTFIFFHFSFEHVVDDCFTKTGSGPA
jgi:hypothetical protein